MPRHYTSLISNIFGKFAGTEFPSAIQGFVNRSYVKLVGLDMDAFAAPKSYPTLNALFTRAFVEEPVFDAEESAVLSPCDALVTDRGTIMEGKAHQIKGMAYGLSGLLGMKYAQDMNRLEGGEYINLYLSPCDYHRYHMPMNLSVQSLLHIPGKLYPVNMPLLRNKLDLFIENERVILECLDDQGKKHYIVLVGALNVGKMVVSFEERIATNSNAKERKYYAYSQPKQLERAELFGWFEMGSTVLLFSEKDSVAYTSEIGKKVSFGDVIGSRVAR